jgi:hypothetical protein
VQHALTALNALSALNVINALTTHAHPVTQKKNALKLRTALAQMRRYAQRFYALKKKTATLQHAHLRRFAKKQRIAPL